MCGIAGLVDNQSKNNKETLEQMTGIIDHRGPDDDGFFLDGGVGLGMRRLSIIDLESGDQPIFSEDNNFVIVFNGEIYNYKKLRESLVKEGVSFSTHSDTEVILKLYEREGEQMLTKLRGMFAFSIYNKREQTVFIARDYFGIKPLYYYGADGVFAFGSEIKSIISVPGFVAKVNEKGFFRYLSYQYVPGNETLFEGVYKLMPGSFMVVSAQSGEILNEEKYWQFEFNQKEQDEEELRKEVLSVLEDSVEAHMVADVPVAAFLSGGIDSTAISALMQEKYDQNVKTFSVGFEGANEFDDSRVASKFIKSDHTEIMITPDEYFENLPKLIWAFDEPVADPSAIALYFVAREAAKHVKVVLSGEGADELFGGYNIYREPLAVNRLNIVPKFIRNTALFWLSNSKLNFYGKNYLKRCFVKIEDRFIGNAFLFKQNELESLWKGEKYSDQTEVTKSFYEEVEELSDSTKMQYIDINFWLPGDILAKADKMTMINSLELRVPFLDKKVAKIASSVPDRLKFKNGDTKYILRESLKGVIPEQNRRKRKLGFPVPMSRWFREGDRSKILDKIKENPYIKDVLDENEVNNLIEDHISGVKDNGRKLYMLLIFSLWYEIYISKTGQIA